MIDPRIICEEIIDKIMRQGEAKGHGRDVWFHEPITMHLMKGSRHGLTAIGMLDHPEFVKDKETVLQHIDQAITRMAFARAILTQKGLDNENQQNLFSHAESKSAPSRSNGVGNDNNPPRELSREYETCEGCGKLLGGDNACRCASI